MPGAQREESSLSLATPSPYLAHVPRPCTEGTGYQNKGQSVAFQAAKAVASLGNADTGVGTGKYPRDQQSQKNHLLGI